MKRTNSSKDYVTNKLSKSPSKQDQYPTTEHLNQPEELYNVSESDQALSTTLHPIIASNKLYTILEEQRRQQPAKQFNMFDVQSDEEEEGKAEILSGIQVIQSPSLNIKALNSQQ